MNSGSAQLESLERRIVDPKSALHWVWGRGFPQVEAVSLLTVLEYSGADTVRQAVGQSTSFGPQLGDLSRQLYMQTLDQIIINRDVIYRIVTAAIRWRNPCQGTRQGLPASCRAEESQLQHRLRAGCKERHNHAVQLR